jgi:hypothetical protein
VPACIVPMLRRLDFCIVCIALSPTRTVNAVCEVGCRRNRCRRSSCARKQQVGKAGGHARCRAWFIHSTAAISARFSSSALPIGPATRRPTCTNLARKNLARKNLACRCRPSRHRRGRGTFSEAHAAAINTFRDAARRRQWDLASIFLTARVAGEPRALLATMVGARPRQRYRCRGFLPGSGHEHVTDAAHGADNVGVRRIGLYLPTQASNAQVDSAVERLHLAMRSHFQ